MEDKDIKILEAVVNYRKFDGIYSTNEVIFKAIEKLLQAYKQDEKIIKEMALYIRNIKTDYEQKYCNVDNCNYHNTNCSYQCIIDYFRKRCE